MRRRSIISVILTAAILIGSISFTASADESNGQSGTGKINKAYSAYYCTDEYGWRVSIYVSKYIGFENEEYKSKSLTEDYYYLGYANIVKEGMIIDSNIYFGCDNKIGYLSTGVAELIQFGNCHAVENCPAPPIICDGGDIDTVNSYFLSNKTILWILKYIAIDQGLLSSFDLVKDLWFYHKYEENGETKWEAKTGEGWGEEYIFPEDSRLNYVPWVIIYEPMVCIYLANGAGAAFLTSTEMALTQGNSYNWLTVGTDKGPFASYGGVGYLTAFLTPQCVQSLAFVNFPKSVTLTESWFGYTPPPDDVGYVWDIANIFFYGGWGMGFLSPAVLAPKKAMGGFPYDPNYKIESNNPKKEPKKVTLSLQAYTPSCNYTIGEDVVTGYRVTNESDKDIYYEDYIVMEYTVTDSSNPENVIKRGQTDPIEVPAGEDTVVWFRWTTPSGVNSVSVEAGLVSDATVLEGDGLATKFTNGTKFKLSSHTAEPKFEDKKPFNYPAPQPAAVSPTASWHTWSYTSAGGFVKNEYSVTLSVTAAITPDPDIKSTKYKNGEWIMRSGYGVQVSAGVSLRWADGSDASGFAGVTGGQNVFFIFPEFTWAEYVGSFESSELVGGKYVFPSNPDAEGDRIHYTPLWYPDGSHNYYIGVTAADCWTPVGVLTARGFSDGISINGSLYDDWYVTSGS